eukprot:jgi/Chlat1/2807/Chrsp187S08765
MRGWRAEVPCWICHTGHTSTNIIHAVHDSSASFTGHIRAGAEQYQVVSPSQMQQANEYESHARPSVSAGFAPNSKHPQMARVGKTRPC